NIDENYVNYTLIFLRNKWKKYAISSRKDPNISKKDIENFLIPIPPIKEQQKIAEILSTCDEAIEKQEKLIKEKEKFKKALMQRLLNVELRMENGELKKLPKVRFKEFSGEWVEVRLKDILTEKKEYATKNEGYTHLSMSKDGIFPKTEQFDRDFLVKDENKKYKITKFGDICYNPANLKFGVICKNEWGNGIFSPIYVTFEVNKKFNTDFIKYIVTSEKFIKKSLKYQEGTVYERMAVKPNDLLLMKIFIPLILKEQEKIAEVLSTLDKEIDLLKLELNEFKKLKKSLMQKLLTGKVRVRV
ncbi:restriction endonuclease subunit S, partial [Nautilia sp.]